MITKGTLLPQLRFRLGITECNLSSMIKHVSRKSQRLINIMNGNVVTNELRCHSSMYSHHNNYGNISQYTINDNHQRNIDIDQHINGSMLTNIINRNFKQCINH